MSKYVQMYSVNTRLNSMDDTIHRLEGYVKKHLEKNNDLKVKQVEYAGGDNYGMNIIVVYEDSAPKPIEKGSIVDDN